MARYGDQPLNFTLIAAVAVPRGRVVQGSGENYCGLATATDQKLLGIALQDNLTGDHVSICQLGEAEAVVGSAVAAYDRLTSTASGYVAPALTASGTNATIIGYAMEAGAIGDSVRVMCQQPVTIGAV